MPSSPRSVTFVDKPLSQHGVGNQSSLPEPWRTGRRWTNWAFPVTASSFSHGPITRAPLPLAVPAANVAHGSNARHGCHRPASREVSNCRPPLWRRPQSAAAASGGSVTETRRPSAGHGRQPMSSMRSPGLRRSIMEMTWQTRKQREELHRLVRGRPLV